MNPRLRTQLLEALRSCMSMSDKARRQAVIDFLPAEIAQNIRRNDATNYDVFFILEACEAYQDGIQKLVDAIEVFDTSSTAFNHLRVVWGYVQKAASLGDPQLQKLVVELGLDPQRAARLFGRTLADYRLSYAQPIDDAWEALQALANFPSQPEKLQPAQLFVERLAYQAETELQRPDLALALWAWNDSHTAAFNTPQDELIARRQVILQGLDELTSSEPPALLVVLDPDPTNTDKQKRFKYRVSLWKQMGPDGQVPLQVEEQFVDTTVLVQNLTNLAENAPLSDAARALLRLEFFLPLKYLSEAVDQLTYMDIFGNMIKLGEQYPVVVRSLERARRPNNSPDWARRWQRVKGRQPNLISQLQASNEPGALLKALRAAAEVACVCLQLPGGCQPLQDIHLGQLLGAGAPIIVWPRACDENGAPLPEAQDAVTALATRPVPDDLPTVIFEARRQALQPNAAGNYLALLWDDPERLPADLAPNLAARLQTP